MKQSTIFSMILVGALFSTGTALYGMFSTRTERLRDSARRYLAFRRHRLEPISATWLDKLRGIDLRKFHQLPSKSVKAETEAREYLDQHRMALETFHEKETASEFEQDFTKIADRFWKVRVDVLERPIFITKRYIEDTEKRLIDAQEDLNKLMEKWRATATNARQQYTRQQVEEGQKYYATLGLPQDSNLTTIKERHRELIHQYHKEMDEVKRKMREINVAVDELEKILVGG